MENPTFNKITKEEQQAFDSLGREFVDNWEPNVATQIFLNMLKISYDCSSESKFPAMTYGDVRLYEIALIMFIKYIEESESKKKSVPEPDVV